MTMNKKTITKVLFLVPIITIAFTLTSCVIDNISSYCISNRTNDTLYIVLSTSDTLDNLIYYCEQSDDTLRPIAPKDTTRVFINGKIIILDNLFYALPDSTVFVSPRSFEINDTCYIYTIKSQVATQYTIEEIRAKKMYDRRSVTKKDFRNCIFEYRSGETSGVP